MPNRDGTGPQGKGPRTGKGNGNCGKQNPQGNYQGQGQGHRGGHGQGGPRFQNQDKE